MTKQEKLAVKNSLLSIKDSLFSDAWEDIVSDHPYVLQSDDDIEDDVLIVADVPDIPSWQVGRDKMKNRADNTDLDIIKLKFNDIASAWDARIEMLNGLAKGYEKGLGIYFNTRNTFIFSDYVSTSIVPTDDEDEQEYLMHLGYKRISDIITILNN